VESISDADNTVESIRNSASNLLSIFRSKLESLKGNNEITKFFIRQGFDARSCFEEARKFFGAEEVRYLAIDGTDYDEARLDMLIFYAGAFGYSGTIRFEDSRVVAEPPRSSDDSFSLSSAIPLSDEYTSVVGEKTESGTDFDRSKVASSLMRLAEYYLAYNSVISDETIKIVLLDRTVSGDIAHISWKLREPIAREDSSLLGFETTAGRISKADLELGRMLVQNDALGIPAARSHFLKFAAMNLLMKESPLTLEGVVSKLNAKPERTNKIEKDLTETFGREFTRINKDSTFLLNERVRNYWERLLAGTLSLSKRIFHPSGNMHPMRIKMNPDRWMTIEDIDYLTLILITALIREAWERHILVLGIVKDSAGNELVKTVIPILRRAHLVKLSQDIPAFESDKMLLQANSVANSGSIRAPWRTFEYDASFRTISIDTGFQPETRVGECRVVGAFKNVISAERMFVKSYFQLWNSETDPVVRSPVFIYDRPCYPEYDACQNAQLKELELINMDNNIEEQILPTIHFLKDSPMANLVIGILSSMGMEAIPEALGHNYPLFLADKRAKIAQGEASRMCVAAVDLEISKSRLDQQILFERRFRDYRSKIESARKSKSE
jgi:hypothetical protein